MDTDGNLAALRQHEKEIEENEKALESFNEETLDELESLFYEKAKEYGFDDTNFTDWIKENV